MKSRQWCTPKNQNRVGKKLNRINMKIFKLTYLAFVLVAGLLGSCTATDNLPEAAVNAAIENGDFVMDPNMHYFVDGISTNDKDLIESKMKNAWNVHFDGSKNKVVISTSPAEFEKYKDSNIEFKNALAENDKAALNNSNEKKGSDIASKSNATTSLPAGAPANVNLIYKDKSVICFKFFRQDNYVYMIQFIPTYSPDMHVPVLLHTQAFNRSTGATIKVFEGTNQDITYYFPYNAGYYFLMGLKIMMNNESASNSLTKSFYTGKSYTGSSHTFTVGANANIDLGILTSKVESYK